MDSVGDEDCTCNLHQQLKTSDGIMEGDFRISVFEVQQNKIKIE